MVFSERQFFPKYCYAFFSNSVPADMVSGKWKTRLMATNDP